MLATVDVPPRIEKEAVCGVESRSNADNVIVLGGVHVVLGGEYCTVTAPGAEASVIDVPDWPEDEYEMLHDEWDVS